MSASAGFATVMGKGLGFLDLRQNIRYLEKPIPNERDGEIHAFLAGFLDMSVAEREVTLWAIEARRGLLALGIAWRGDRDQREIWIVMAVVCDALVRCGVDARSELREISGIFPADVASEIVAFAARPDLDTVVRDMGYVDGSDADGSRYARTW